MKTPLLIVASLSAMLCSFGAQAQSDGSGAFIRGGFGKARADGAFNGSRVNGTSYNLGAGYWFNRNFGIEGFYTRQLDGKTDFRLPGTTAAGSSSTRLQGFGVGVVGKMHLMEEDTGLFVSGRAGVARMKLDNTTAFPAVGTTAARRVSVSQTSTSPYWGLGLGYDFTPQMGVSLNYDQYRAKLPGISAGQQERSVKSNEVSANFEYRF